MLRTPIRILTTDFLLCFVFLFTAFSSSSCYLVEARAVAARPASAVEAYSVIVPSESTSLADFRSSRTVRTADLDGRALRSLGDEVYSPTSACVGGSIPGPSTLASAAGSSSMQALSPLPSSSAWAATSMMDSSSSTPSTSSSTTAMSSPPSSASQTFSSTSLPPSQSSPTVGSSSETLTMVVSSASSTSTSALALTSGSTSYLVTSTAGVTSLTLSQPPDASGTLYSSPVFATSQPTGGLPPTSSSASPSTSSLVSTYSVPADTSLLSSPTSPPSAAIPSTSTFDVNSSTSSTGIPALQVSSKSAPTSSSAAGDSQPQQLSATIIAVIAVLSFVGLLSLVLGTVVFISTRRRRLERIQQMVDVEGQPAPVGSRFSVSTRVSAISRHSLPLASYNAASLSRNQSYAPSIGRPYRPPNPYEGVISPNTPLLPFDISDDAVDSTVSHHLHPGSQES
ncbi:hypothetical protein BV22DRAFT_478280 [Leucogyrophana mollusca]|uniref:Uncharacterized protein n=1 Tax=Leucogyrophana mollusca TaxID=85980 RepID=A0ACB8BGK9_9AGAM|nr:hypothetical protein BV22DRAFT_478280 [Leucogyrophana mollusca]